MINRKILISGVSILSALTMLGSGAFAVFSSTASNANNQFGAGSLVLALNGFGGSGSPAVFNVANAAPGGVTTQVITLSNVGSVASTTTKLDDITHSGSVPDLGDKLNLELWDDVNGNGVIDAGDIMRGSAPITSAAWTSIDMGFGLPAGGTHKVIAQITVDPSTDNTYQSATSTFALNFSTSQ